MEKKCSPIIINEISEALGSVFSFSTQVIAVVLFGSSAKGDHSGKSDVDIAVYVRDPQDFSLRDKLTLHGECCRALKRNDVDLVVMNHMTNLILLEHIIREGIVIYSTDNDELDIFMAEMLHRVIDFRNHRDRAMHV